MIRLTFFLLLTLSFLTLSAQKTVQIGILTDFEKSDKRSESINKLILTEVQKITGSAYNVVLKDENIYSVGWNSKQAEASYAQLENSCDIIIIVGVVSVSGVINRKVFKKPTIAVGVFDPKVQGLPKTEDETTGIKNFYYILTSQDAETELKKLKELTGFNNLTVLFDKRSITSINPKQDLKVRAYIAEKVGAKIDFIAINTQQLQASLKQTDSTDAVYIGIPYELEDSKIKEIIDYYNARKIPVFAMSHDHLLLGALASFTVDNGVQQILKKVAITIDDVLRGAELSEINVRINHKEELFINMITARKIGFDPNFKDLFTANIIGDPASFSTKVYSLTDILKTVLKENLNLRISQYEVALSETDVDNAISQFLPSAELQASGVIINEERANPLAGQAERSLSGTAKVQQLIYSEPAIANITIQRYLSAAQKHASRQEVLTQVLNTMEAYFAILQAKTNLKIQQENISVSKKNLELAKLRRKIGQKSSADVYRWESEVATSNQNVIEANAQLILARSQLNTRLNNSLEEEFDVEDTGIEDGLFEHYATSHLAEYIRSPQQFKNLTEFLISEAYRSYPSKRQLQLNLSAINRQVTMHKRAYYTPTIALSGQVDQNMYRGGFGSEPPPGSTFNNTNWSAALSLSYPLFDGNRRKVDLQKSLIQQKQVETELDNLNNNLSLQVQNNAINLFTSTTKINYTRVSSENAQHSFELIQENYHQGTVSITELIDAQKAALNARQAYALSVYTYLLNFLKLENSIGQYSMLSSQAEKKAFYERFKTFMVGKK